MIVAMKRLIKLIFKLMDYDIVRVEKSPGISLLGLRNIPIRTVIDVGANTGQFARMIERVFPEAKIYSFEPLPEAYKELEKLSKIKDGKVEAFNLALGDSDGEIEMFYHTEHSPFSSILKTTEVCERYYPFTKNKQTIKVKMTTMDKAIDELDISLIPEVLIKLDVQGYENRVIKGGRETFKIAKACILEVCLDKLFEDQAEFKEITELLYDMGFKYAGNLNQSFAKDGHIISIDAVFMRK
jgi:FkbM family methyltransferase